MIHLLLITALFALSGCGVELQDARPPSTRAAVPFSLPSHTPAPMAGPHHEIIAGPQPNEYFVRLHPPTGTSRIEKSGAEFLQSQNLTSEVDQAVQAGGTYGYRFKGSGEVSIEVEIPKDLHIQGIQKLETPLKNFRRIFFSENSLLLTEGKDLDLFAEEIIAGVNSSIQAFVAPALEGQNGKSAGHLRIGAYKVAGVLKIEMRGQTGGPGLSGAPHSERSATGAGHRGNFSGFVSSCSDNKPGNAGTNGAVGRDGAQGLVGGDGGRVEIFVEALSNKNVRTRVDGGAGGVGGRGGPGQLGGFPGPSMNYGTFNGNYAPIPCPVVPNLGEGLTGPTGRDGQAGAPGNQGVISSQF